MARLLLGAAYSSMSTAQTGLAALTIFFCAFTLFMCASHSPRWRRWTACYRSGTGEPVIQLQNEGMIFDPSYQGGENQQVSGPIWQKNIPMGGKCQLPDFSGVIIYDSAGTVVTPAKNSRLALPWNYKTMASKLNVKQQKRSSNRWSCVICNQKQSVKKVYAQGYQAKDIRQFVQSFNMSRKNADEQAALGYELSSVGHFVEHPEGTHVEEEYRAKKHTDWREYIEYEEDAHPAYLKSLPNEGHMFEPEIVTEDPEGLLLKKAKLKGKFFGSSSSSGSGLDRNQIYNPRFPKRDANNEACMSRVEVSKTEANNNDLPRNVTRGWQQEQQESLHQQQNKQMTMVKRGVSKWSEYMEDENHHFLGEKAAFADDFKLNCGYDLQTDVTDERVEEDIHPDFL
ncbi:hypothetical protein Cgig2_007769 [Carnegiea gigantea]|uniref:MRN complex-interacting protein N-terminal domain-containing protein n=1 Tax=Carnegiea gigantea TaxID=171969 RepID=A0A9Q1JFZ4_9CARY|nr:hypothetical protein Cgig2_007769 [Carnegiea gigantea]